MKVILRNDMTGSELMLTAEDHPRLLEEVSSAIRAIMGTHSDLALAATGNGAKKRGRPPGTKTTPMGAAIPEANPQAEGTPSDDGPDLHTI
jgi:hypothetical protein